MEQFKEAVEQITKIAQDFGLDFHEMVYEIIPENVLYTFGSSGMPNRFSHWSFGKRFESMRRGHYMGMGRIYEMVINSDPCYAFFLDSNTLFENKLIAAHVLAHSDFFKNNIKFKRSNKKMLELMDDNSRKIAEFEREYGFSEVEKILDRALCIEEQTELLSFLIENSSALSDWQREILRIVRDERAYFSPQAQTKILNEGWATFWHSKIMREMNLTFEEALQCAKMHAEVIAPTAGGINPYLLGFRILKDIEKRYGIEKLFEVREMCSDASLIRNYLTEELADELDLYVFSKGFGDKSDKMVVQSTSFEEVKETLIASLANEGRPLLEVSSYKVFADETNGRLKINHLYDDVEIDVKDLELSMALIQPLWGYDVEFFTVLDNRKVCFTRTDKKSHRRFI